MKLGALAPSSKCQCARFINLPLLRLLQWMLLQRLLRLLLRLLLLMLLLPLSVFLRLRHHLHLLLLLLLRPMPTRNCLS